MSRLQASRHVAAHVLAPSEEALDTPLGPPRSLAVPGVCYSALRRLPRRDLHPLETNSVKQTLTSASSRRENGSFYGPRRQEHDRGDRSRILTRYSPSARPVLAVRDSATPGSQCDAGFHHGLLARSARYAPLENEKSPAILPPQVRRALHFQPMTGLALLRLPALGVLALGALGTQQLDLGQQLVELAREHLGVARLGR